MKFLKHFIKHRKQIALFPKPTKIGEIDTTNADEIRKVIERVAEQDRKTSQATEVKQYTDLGAAARDTKRKAKQNLLTTPKVNGDKAQMQWALANVRKQMGRTPPKKRAADLFTELY